MSTPTLNSLQAANNLKTNLPLLQRFARQMLVDANVTGHGPLMAAARKMVGATHALRIDADNPDMSDTQAALATLADAAGAAAKTSLYNPDKHAGLEELKNLVTKTSEAVMCLSADAATDADLSAVRVEEMRRRAGLPPLSAADVLRLSGCGQSPELARVNEYRAFHHLEPLKELPAK